MSGKLFDLTGRFGLISGARAQPPVVPPPPAPLTLEDCIRIELTDSGIHRIAVCDISLQEAMAR